MTNLLLAFIVCDMLIGTLLIRFGLYAERGVQRFGAATAAVMLTAVHIALLALGVWLLMMLFGSTSPPKYQWITALAAVGAIQIAAGAVWLFFVATNARPMWQKTRRKRYLWLPLLIAAIPVAVAAVLLYPLLRG